MVVCYHSDIKNEAVIKINLMSVLGARLCLLCRELDRGERVCGVKINPHTQLSS